MRRISLAAACFLLSTLAVAGQPVPSPSDSPGAKLPPGDGRDLVMRTCSKCHTPDIVAEQTLDAAGWKELVNQMAGNGAQGSDADFAQITDYLTKSFPAK
jgi:mono/diheme cytochrome c family protein